MSLHERLTRLEATLPPMGASDDGARLRLAARLDALAARVQARPAPLDQQSPAERLVLRALDVAGGRRDARFWEVVSAGLRAYAQERRTAWA